ncbi:hypothetical protein Tco_0576776 [Tanacetum coccineum]
MGMVNGSIRPVLKTNVQRLNHQNKFVPKAVLTKTGIFLVMQLDKIFLVKQQQLVLLGKTTTPKANFTSHKINTAGDKTVSAVGGNRETAVKASADPKSAMAWVTLTGIKPYLVDKSDYNGGLVAFGGKLKVNNAGTGLKTRKFEANDAAEAFRKEFAQFNTVSTPISNASPLRVFSAGVPDLPSNDQDDSQIHALEEIYDNPSDGIFTNTSYDDEGVVADFTNLETTVNVSLIPTSRIHSIHPTTQILRDPKPYS